MLPLIVSLLVMNPTGQNEEPIDLVRDGDFSQPLPPDWSSTVTHLHIVSGESKKFPKVLHLEFDSPSSARPQDLSLSTKTTGLIHLGDTVGIKVWMRGDPKGTASSVKVRFVLRRLDEPSPDLIEKTFTLSSGWKEYKTSVTAPTQLLAGEAELAIQFGFGSGIVDLAKLRVQELGDASPSSHGTP